MKYEGMKRVQAAYAEQFGFSPELLVSAPEE